MGADSDLSGFIGDEHKPMIPEWLYYLFIAISYGAGIFSGILFYKELTKPKEKINT